MGRGGVIILTIIIFTSHLTTITSIVGCVYCGLAGVVGGVGVVVRGWRDEDVVVL